MAEIRFGKKIKKALLVTSIPLLVANYAPKFQASDFTLPETRVSSLAQRINPVNNLMNVPRSLAYGTWNTVHSAYMEENKPRALYKFSEGVVSTWLDSSVNFLSFLPLEICEAISGTTFKESYTPFTNISQR